MICLVCRAPLTPGAVLCEACGTPVQRPPELAGMHLPPPSAADRVVLPPPAFVPPVATPPPPPPPSMPTAATPPPAARAASEDYPSASASTGSMPPPPPPSTAYASAPPPPRGAQPVDIDGTSPQSQPQPRPQSQPQPQSDRQSQPEPPVWNMDASHVPFVEPHSEPSTVWSIPDLITEEDSDLPANSSHTVPRATASDLIAQALREAEEQVRAHSYAHSAAASNAVDDAAWNLAAHQPTPRWFFVLGDGSSVDFGVRALVGRAATADDRWPDAELVTLHDPTISMSKTHVRLEVDELGLVVVDLFSLNGTVITADDGQLIDLRDGQRTRLTAGARIALGDFVARLERV
jgi:hypothetical protein